MSFTKNPILVKMFICFLSIVVKNVMIISLNGKKLGKFLTFQQNVKWNIELLDICKGCG